LAEHILVVDDDPTVSSFIEAYLRKQGFQVGVAGDGGVMRRYMAVNDVDLVILDLTLPGEDGLDLARHLRETSDTPIIILTARSDAIDRIVGLEMGADDYLAKPFEARELLARIKSVLRRCSRSVRQDTGLSASLGTLARFAAWRLDLSTRRLFSDESGSVVKLTAAEFDLLVALVSNAGEVMNRNRLLDLACNREASAFDRSIDVHVMNIRKKIEDNPRHPIFIQTIRGAGYVFTPKVEWS
jgi:two-component system, OmpR family, response regulator